MQAILSEALPLTTTPKGVIQKMGNKIDNNLSESAKAKKNSVIAYLIVFSEYGMTHASISSVALPLTAWLAMGKKGATKLLFIYVKEPRLKSLT